LNTQIAVAALGDAAKFIAHERFDDHAMPAAALKYADAIPLPFEAQSACRPSISTSSGTIPSQFARAVTEITERIAVKHYNNVALQNTGMSGKSCNAQRIAAMANP
jgi:hypothetical protein